MRTSADMYMTQVNKSKQIQAGFRKTQRLLSLMVIVCVFWGLKLTGITMAGEAFCGMEEHVHTETCAMQEAICGQEESEGHVHTQDCLQKTLNCGFTEQPGHSHSEDCSGATLICTQEETEGHSHTEECFQQTLTCTTPEQAMHNHGADCYTQTFTCGLEENENHQHDETCSIVRLSCDLPESAGHSHGADCYDKIAVCGKEEAEGHVHSDGCYSTETSYLCGMEEVQEHFHTDACYVIEEETYICGLEEKEGHSHTAACYESQESCTLEEHIHTPNCYSDISADLETSEDWEASLSNLIRVSNAPDNLVIVARSQLDMTESSRNFQVDELGIRRGITRYGQWYGNPYGDWSAMFVSFCLEYAGVEDLPRNAGVESMRLEWEAEEFYVPAEEWDPTAGDLLFLDKDEDGAADAVAIVTDLKENVIFAIEGDIHDPVSQIGSVELHPEPEVISFEMHKETIRLYEAATTVEDAADEGSFQEIDPAEDCAAMEEPPLDRVAETLYAAEDPAIMGYGLVPIGGDYATLAAGDPCYIWLDGTDGGLGHLTGSPEAMYEVKEEGTLTLPTKWDSPSKYNYKLRGWYDITNSVYYEPGEEMTVKGNAVLYADWVASTYDIGQFNAQVADTVSTNSFITTHMFDYNYLFNIHSVKARGSVNSNGHSETWSMVTSGNVAHQGQQTFDFIFVDNDTGGLLCIPNDRSDRNVYPGAGIVTPGIYSEELYSRLFDTNNCFDPVSDTGILGKTYLGTGDHLFQIMDDPTDEHYGYYYYDSKHNAASYNQSNQRFYVYEYLECTSDAIGSTYSDFLPLNSPYANTNGKNVSTYDYSGEDKEYQGVTHYRYDSKYNSGNYNSANNVQTDYAYGMRSDIQFYLPNDPGTGGNKDLYGNDMQFQFSGDDDLWVLIDGKLVLDIGGIHGAEDGVIDFSTGQITVQGKDQTSLIDLGIGAGDHTLSVLYLERGSSLSNCSIYFNMAPRFGLEIKKEDVLTQKILNGTQFTVYQDSGCTVPAHLWENEAAYYQDRSDGILDNFKSTFTVTDGTANMWGLGSGNTYYIKETKPPDAEGYGLAEGIIRLTIERKGLTTYKADVIPDEEGKGPSNGFTIHGVRIDESEKMVYLTATNAPETVTETTTVQVVKIWDDDGKVDHSNDYIEAYLTVVNPDGTSNHIREVVLSNENNWQYMWTNLPKYNYDQLTEVTYGIEESYESGYYSTVRKITKIDVEITTWAEAGQFLDGESYILKSSNGYLSTTSSSDAKLQWVEESTAKTSSLATWTATVNRDKKVKLTNGAGQILTYNGSDRNNRYFYATTSNSNNNQNFTVVDVSTGFQFYVTRNYYMSTNPITNGRIPSTSNNSNTNSRLILTPMEQVTKSETQDVQNWGYQITNSPLAQGNETSLTVRKEWVIPEGSTESLYEESSVVVRLLANSVNTGRTVTLTLKNGWSATFPGLPYKDENGNVIQYTVEELWEKEYWSTTYGEIKVSEDATPKYSTTITNTYRRGGPELPSTGTAARMLYVLCGGSMMLASLVYGILLRCRRERRRHKPS